MKYTAEEVRKSASWLYQWERDWLYQWERKAGVRNARAMLTAYADLLEQIKADEGVANKLVVPVAWMCETVNGYKVFNAEGPSFPCNAGFVSELFAHPPAQAEQGETACPKCGATNPEDAATRCRPDGDSCPGCEDPLAQAWDRKAAQPAQSVDVAKVRRVAADIRHWNEAICHPALNVFADKLEAAIKGVAP